MRTGICTRCGSHQVYTSGPASRQAPCPTKVSFLPDYLPLTNYACAVCGYTESYIADPNTLREITRHWDRVYPTPYR